MTEEEHKEWINNSEEVCTSVRTSLVRCDAPLEKFLEENGIGKEEVATCHKLADGSLFLYIKQLLYTRIPLPDQDWPSEQDPHPKRKQVTIYLDPILAKQLKVHAAQNDKEMSDVVAIALQQYLGPNTVMRKNGS